MSEPSPLLSPELLERVTSSARGKRWLELLTRRNVKNGIENPEAAEAAASEELASQLTGVLERLAKRYQKVKIGALQLIERLQIKTNDFYAEALASGNPSLARLERLLADLDAGLHTLATGIDDVATQPEPATEPPRGMPADKLNKRYGLTADQSKFFKGQREAATGDPAALDDMRYRRKQTARQNLGEETETPEQYKARVEKTRIAEIGETATKEASELRPAVGEYLGRKLESGDSFLVNGEKRSFVITEKIGDEEVTSRPDGVTLNASGEPEPEPILQEHKTWMGGEDPVIGNSQQMKAQRKYALDHGGKHVVSISAQNPELDAIPPKPRPSDALGSESTVVFVDRGSKKVVRRWDSKKSKWIKP